MMLIGNKTDLDYKYWINI